jgi:CPA2 family monovalent cation:H+ antiporter-2
LFFFFFGLEVDPASILPALPFALGLGVITLITKVFTGYWAGRRQRIGQRGSLRAGAELVARGEFSIVIAGLGVAVDPRIGPLSAGYVLLMAIAGPVLARIAK